MSWSGAALMAGTVTTGLAAGLFATFSYAVMPGLARTDDATFVRSMQGINVAILNGWFAISFGGALVFTAIAAGLHLSRDNRSALPWILAGLALYVAVLATTFVINVPLNERLDAATTNFTAAREAFERSWVRWNHVRSVLNTAAFGCLCWALVLHGRLPG